PENNMEWTDEGVAVAQRFLNRIVGLFSSDRAQIAAHKGAQLVAPADGADRTLYRRLNETIKKVTQDTEAFRFNTAIASLMELLNDAVRYRAEAGVVTP